MALSHRVFVILSICQLVIKNRFFWTTKWTIWIHRTLIPSTIKIVLKIIMRCPDEPGIATAQVEPPIWLPEQLPDPAKLIDEKKKH